MTILKWLKSSSGLGDRLEFGEIPLGFCVFGVAENHQGSSFGRAFKFSLK